MYRRVLKSASLALTLAISALIPVALAAQNAAKPAANTNSADSPSKWDIFVGYSYLAPHGTVQIPTTPPGPLSATAVNGGVIASVSRYFNKYVGVQGEVDVHEVKENADHTAQDDFSGGSLGLVLRYPTENITPFVHALVGGERAGAYYWPEVWGVVLTAGGGLDYETPWFNHRLAIRIVQADYQYTHEDFYPDGRGNFNMARLSGGLVFHVGTIAPPAPVTLACSASPDSVFPGDPVTVTATAGSLNPKLNAIYTFSGTGVTGSGATATVATGSLAAGSYTVKCNIKEGKAGKEGLKPWETADATANFTVKAFEPPTVGCSASPSTINPGDKSTITAAGVSPQNRPLTYSYSASAGAVSGTGTTATFDSTGAPTGATTVTCNVSDDKGQSATANTNVTITAPYVAPIPHSEALCSIAFETDKKRPARVDNEAKACLDEVALDLQKQTDAKAVIVGDSSAAEKAPKMTRRHAKAAKVADLAAQRAVNTKDYLVTEKGIDASRVSVVTGTTDGQKVEDYLVPSGATFTTDVTGTTPVDETMVKPQARKPLPAHKKHHHAATSK